MENIFITNLNKWIEKEKEIISSPISSDKDKKDSKFIIQYLTNKYLYD